MHYKELEKNGKRQGRNRGIIREKEYPHCGELVFLNL
jgi:hypothetical protein